MDGMHEPASAVSEHEGARGRSRAEGERTPRGAQGPPSFETFFEA